jgi:uncharacterized protein (DUF1786 family)
MRITGILAVDVGRGTRDILLASPGEEAENWVQLILPSRTVLLAAAVAGATREARPVLLRGATMGGGPLTRAARLHLAAGLPLLATPGAAATFSDDPAEVAALGVRTVGEDEASAVVRRGGHLVLEADDVDLAGIRSALAATGLEMDLLGVAVAVQDHGAAPPGESDRRFRFGLLREAMAREADVAAQAWDRRTLAPCRTRMAGVLSGLADVERVVVMDTGFAALTGLLLDQHLAGRRLRLLVNAGNGHTVAALLEGTRLRALFEHHTRCLDALLLRRRLRGLLDGTLTDETVFAEGGHGLWRDGGPLPPVEAVAPFALSGPRRAPFAHGEGDCVLAAPFGSMMQTGSFGLLAAFLRATGGTEDLGLTLPESAGGAAA